MSRRPVTRLPVWILTITLFTLMLLISCGGEEVFEPGTLTFNITGADDHNGRNFHYYVDTFLPDKSLDDNKTLEGSVAISGGTATVTLKDPDSPSEDYLFKANNVIFLAGCYIDVDSNGDNNGGIDYEINDPFEHGGSSHIDGDMVVNLAYPTDFHISESGCAGITLNDNTGLMYFRYHQQENDLSNATVGNQDDYTCRIENTGMALLTLTGSPYVQVTGDTDVFSITTQPSVATVVPNDYVTFVMSVNAGSPGTYQAEIVIPFDDTNNDDDDNASPYKAVFNVTVN